MWLLLWNCYTRDSLRWLYIHMYGIIAAHGIVTSHSWYHYGLWIWISKDIDIHVTTYIIGIVDSMTYWYYDIPIFGIGGIIVVLWWLLLSLLYQYGKICSSLLYQLFYKYYYTTIIPLLYTVEHILLEESWDLTNTFKHQEWGFNGTTYLGMEYNPINVIWIHMIYIYIIIFNSLWCFPK